MENAPNDSPCSHSADLGGLPSTFWWLWAGWLLSALANFVFPFLAFFLTARGFSPSRVVLATSPILAKGRVSGGETVVVMESSEHRRGVDRGVRSEVRWPGRGAERGWPPLADPLVRTRGVEVVTVLIENALEMALAQQET